jgi:hypothetical protein
MPYHLNLNLICRSEAKAYLVYIQEVTDRLIGPTMICTCIRGRPVVTIDEQLGLKIPANKVSKLYISRPGLARPDGP